MYDSACSIQKARHQLLNGCVQIALQTPLTVTCQGESISAFLFQADCNFTLLNTAAGPLPLPYKGGMQAVDEEQGAEAASRDSHRLL